MKSDLNFIINERHKVMHHRPMRLETIEVLASKEQKITALLGASEITLEVSEREKVKQEFEQVMLASEKAHRAEVARLTQLLGTDVGLERFSELFRTLRPIELQQRWLEDIPTSQELAATQKRLLATMPSEAELKRNLERIQAALPTTQQFQEEVERTSRMLKQALDQSEALLGQTQSIQENLAPVKAAWEQLQRHQGR